MPTVFITGANRGIGLEFARQYAADGWRVLATARDPQGATELNEIEGDVTIARSTSMPTSLRSTGTASSAPIRSTCSSTMPA
jgi:NAD(P)-dependent dehydrogenase (short-subunit alcohol dehydrogenase family)